MEIEQRLKTVNVMALDMEPAVVVDESMATGEVIQRMKAGDSGCALVTGHGKLTGILTERDVARQVFGTPGALQLPVSMWMTPEPDTVQRTDPIRKVVRLMERGGFRNVPVVDEDRQVVGCVTHRDFINYLGGHYARRVLNLPPEPGRVYSHREGA